MRRAILYILLLLGGVEAEAIGLERYVPPKSTIKKLPSGMTLFLLEDHEFPLVEVSFYIRGGSVFDPVGREGLASLALKGIRYGGMEGRPPEEIEEELEFLGSSLEVGVNEEFGYGTLRVLKKDVATGIRILFDLLKRPAWDPEQVKILQEQTRDSLLRLPEDPLELALRKFPSLVYGPKSPWGRFPTIRSIERISRKDLRKYHRRFVGPDRIVLAASGDFDPEELLKWIEKETAGWTPLKGPPPTPPPLKPPQRGKMLFLPREGLKQSTILMGHLGGSRDDPDKFPLLVMNYILGGSGSLSSRFGEEIRIKRGQAYAVWSDYGFGPEKGIFYAATQTALDNTREVTLTLKGMLQETSQKPSFSDEELDRAKRVLLSSLFFSYETRSALIRDIAKFYLWGYPDNYLEIFQEKIEGLKPSEVERVSRQHLHPKDLVTLVISDPTTEGDLRSVGKVERFSP